ncbi:hypothetical protein [Jannaschia aquimarina]|uniref:Uncharacterized protein n=1 Tax=Jannaschia aquimarina TaxID=935700 RepID=A0A0D1EGG8_9RHOB|nr:hypothetical protein [Jannaschia aquimarina]KIT14940.1 hypothetical protein jaqu_32650 [Jannaschia aquimarina]SNS59935.1 hypothetical protein SAMN05421775_101590 [Jannaschia aquimarina]
MAEKPILSIRLNGRFRVEGPDRVSLTPRGTKAQGILALLATAPEHERGRVWLQGKLWSDRGAPQAAASLRQSLAEIRKAFGDEADVLISTRTTVGLNPDRIEVIEGGGEFLEGLDIADPAFVAWVQSRRTPAPRSFVAPLRRPNRMSVLMRPTEGGSPELKLFETFFMEACARTLRELGDIDVLTIAPDPAPDGLLLADVQAFPLPGGGVALRCSLDCGLTGRMIWSDIAQLNCRGAPEPDDEGLLSLGNRLANAVLDEGLRTDGVTDPDATLMALDAIGLIFTIRPEGLKRAEALLRQAIEIQPRGVYHAWLAQLHAIEFVERFASREDVADKAEAAMRRALEMEPGNSNVLACSANAKLVLFQELAPSGELARVSTDANAANPLGWWALAAAHLYYGRSEEALICARRSRALAGGTRFRFWAEFQTALGAALCDKRLEAIQAAELSSALSPSFRPPLRYLTALHAGNDAGRLAAQAFERLRVLEPDVTASRLTDDPSYPVSLMRKAKIASREQLHTALK